jgi:hypothetical protein
LTAINQRGTLHSSIAQGHFITILTAQECVKHYTSPVPQSGPLAPAWVAFIQKYAATHPDESESAIARALSVKVRDVYAALYPPDGQIHD